MVVHLQATLRIISMSHQGSEAIPSARGKKDTVLISRSTTTDIYHTDRDCSRLKSRGEVLEKPLVVFNGLYRPCKECTEDADSHD